MKSACGMLSEAEIVFSIATKYPVEQDSDKEIEEQQYANKQSFTTKEPKSINLDFEKDVFNSVKTVFKGIHVYGCFFHLTQNFWRKMIKIPGFLDNYYKKESKFKEAFMTHKVLCYVPESDVVYVFKQLKSQLDKSFDPFFKYIEKYYIGKKKKVARYQFPTWNLYNRVLEELPRTNNSVESWHNAFTTNEKKHLNINALVEKMRLEQSNTENNCTRIRSGHLFNRDVDQI
ncbi:hypothetical protein BpHYR1_044164 [Brachionus plicatilis]|uniref:MULE transposase domain-containing protein n=1 Tax=Brachionus plicatilis TaxID=10195 RepID=A0A3M7T1A1_BRAPC|nr:hypothetical protein BpHYR1_044164 [Brachionus plicatilis]